MSIAGAGVALAAIAAAAYLFPRTAAHADPGPRAPEVVYDRTCGYCHGHNVGPIIRGRNLPPEAIIHMVRNGMGAMPAFRPTEISDVELANLARWISASKEDSREHGK